MTNYTSQQGNRGGTYTRILYHTYVQTYSKYMGECGEEWGVGGGREIDRDADADGDGGERGGSSEP